MANEPEIVEQLEPAFERYNEEQFVTVKLPGSSQQVIVSAHSALGGGRYYDVESSSSFAFDHLTQVQCPPTTPKGRADGKEREEGKTQKERS